jgi:hypothetical protein
MRMTKVLDYRSGGTITVMTERVSALMERAWVKIRRGLGSDILLLKPMTAPQENLMRLFDSNLLAAWKGTANLGLTDRYDHAEWDALIEREFPGL